VREYLSSRGLLGEEMLYEIEDRDSKYSPPQKGAMAAARARYAGSGGSLPRLVTRDVFCTPDDVIPPLEQFLADVENRRSVLLDVSSLPKRVFFPVLRRLLESDAIADIAVSYTFPQSYADELAVNYADADDLPGFGRPFPEPENQLVLVSLGHDYVGAAKALRMVADRASRRQVLLPFPAGPASLKKAWESVRALKPYLIDSEQEPVRVDPRDVSDAFDIICGLSSEAGQTLVLVPSGPKTISLAMCLYAIARPDTGVVYSQPSAYNPEYSKGVALLPGTSSGAPECYAYCIRLAGRDFYNLEGPAGTA